MSWNNYPENWEKDSITIKVEEEDKIPKELKIGEKYHLSWAFTNKMVWVLKSYNGVYAFLETPRTKKSICTKLIDLRKINKNALRNANKRINKLNKLK